MKKVYILLTALILGSFVGLIVMAVHYNTAFTETSRIFPGGTRGLNWNTIFILLAVSFILIGISCYFILYQFNRRLRAEKGLREAEQRFSLLVRKEKNYAIFMLDAAGRVISWNEGAENIKGYIEEEVLGQPISIFYTEEDIQREEPANNLKKAAAEGQFESIGLRKRKDGSVFWADVVFTAVRDDTGVLTGYIKITKDITQQKMLEEEMRNSLIREKELNEMKSRFVTLASHEFKTPLSVILSSVSLIDKYNTPGTEDNRHRHVQRIKSNVNNLRQILNDFLSVEKLEAGIVKNNPVPADLVKLTSDVLADMENSCRADQRIISGVHGEPRPVAVDTHLLQNILNNLVSNALKYSPSQGEIRFDLHFGEETVTFRVSDSGIGIPPEDQPHLFERFFRACNTAGIPGTGLGLSIVKKYLDLMGGNIEVISHPGTGTTFTITLPAPLLAGTQPATSVSLSDIQ